MRGTNRRSRLKSVSVHRHNVPERSYVVRLFGGRQYVPPGLRRAPTAQE
jgi:hypothetical protein